MNKPNSLPLSEIFVSLEGESVYAGLPTTFVRLGSCNLRCLYCDTTYAYETRSEMTIDEIIATVGTYYPRRVLVTGGEPLVHDLTPKLIARLVAQGYEVIVETNGSVPIDREIARTAHLVMDIKTPGSGESSKLCGENIDLLKPTDEVKFVVTGETDLAFVLSTIRRYPALSALNILISPAMGLIDAARVAEFILAERLDARLNLQLHKIIWKDNHAGR